jgi:hypothetical protein
LRLGFQRAREEQCDTIATLDGDGAHVPAELGDLMRHHRSSKAALTIGSRFLNQNTAAAIPSSKRAANAFACLVINRVLGAALSDVASGMRVLNAAAVDIALACDTADFGFIYNHISMVMKAGLHISEYPVSVRYDAEELLATSALELADLLSAAKGMAPMSSLRVRADIEAIRRAVSKYKPIHVTDDRQWVIAHPLPKRRSYLFRQQNPFFVALRSEDTWIRLSASGTRSRTSA